MNEAVERDLESADGIGALQRAVEAAGSYGVRRCGAPVEAEP